MHVFAALSAFKHLIQDYLKFTTCASNNDELVFLSLSHDAIEVITNPIHDFYDLHTLADS